ncbi:MAG: TIGR00730 family Rossman fold protein, partial [Blastocatellia bacterium]
GNALGRTLASRGIGLVYGGGGIGVMGAVAGGVIEGGGEVIGIIPHALSAKERALHSLHLAEGKVEMRVVNTMHERKAMMVGLSDAFIILPGGFGTFDEMFEIITWAQLGIHQKPIGLLNVAGYFDPLLAMIDRAIADGFILPRYRGLILVDSEIEPLLAKMAGHQPIAGIVQWIEMSET